jgi:multiple sugar transport system ATP-binding protein
MQDRVRQTLERENAPRELLVGFRPEDFEDAALVDRSRRGVTFTVTVDVLESVGSDVFVHFTEEGGRASTSELDELAADSGLADTGETGHQIVARLAAETRAREGRPIELWLNTDKGHIFDPATGVNLTHPEIVDRDAP